MKWCLLLGLIAGSAGCGDAEDDTDQDTEYRPDTETDDYEGCDETTLDINGPDTPAVGDEWTVWMKCDGALLQGPLVIRFTPAGFANSDVNVITFTTAGDASMRVQVGAYRIDTDITVLP